MIKGELPAARAYLPISPPAVDCKIFLLLLFGQGYVLFPVRENLGAVVIWNEKNSLGT